MLKYLTSFNSTAVCLLFRVQRSPNGWADIPRGGHNKGENSIVLPISHEKREVIFPLQPSVRTQQKERCTAMQHSIENYWASLQGSGEEATHKVTKVSWLGQLDESFSGGVTHQRNSSTLERHLWHHLLHWMKTVHFLSLFTQPLERFPLITSLSSGNRKVILLVYCYVMLLDGLCL